MTKKSKKSKKKGKGKENKTLKRCPNGTRRNKTTKNCESTNKRKFHNISIIINPSYKKLGYIDIKKISEDDILKKTKNYIISKKIPDGDILFIGSSYETRQEYGFVLVDKKKDDFFISIGDDFYDYCYDDEEPDNISSGVKKISKYYGFDKHDYSKAIKDIKIFVETNGLCGYIPIYL